MSKKENNKKTLVIVESPSKAKKIQEYLGDDYMVIASKGHIADLAKGGVHGIGVNLDTFTPKYVLSPDKVEILNEMLSLAKNAKIILLASDEDREGESISWHLQQRLQDTGVPMKRIHFNEITKKAIQKAISNPGEIDLNLVHSQEARRMLDRIVGFMASPFLINKYQSTLSAGRVQSVLTRMIVERDKEIESFVPENYWNIHVTLSDGKTEFNSKYDTKITDIKTANLVDKELSGNKNDSVFVVSDIVAKEEKKAPPAPMITSKLQQVMSKDYGISADRTMKAAQELYESGYCTYIRTDSTRANEDAVKEVREWIVNNKYKVPSKANEYPNKDSSQDAHECIRPTEIDLKPDQNYEIIDPDQKKVYEVIWKYFVASQMMPATYDTLKVTLELKSNPKYKVKASGKALTYSGFMDILGLTDESKIDIPNLSIGDELALSGQHPVRVEKKQTQPAPRYSEANLIKELVSKGIGRPSTYSELLSKVTSRNYVRKDGNMYYATDLGKQITETLNSYFSFMDYNYTSLLEKKLDEIAEGKVDYIDMLKEFYTGFKKELNKSYIEACDSDICEKCNSPMVKRKSKVGNEFLSCSSYPACKNAKNISKNVS